MKFKALCTILLPKDEGRRKIGIGETFELKGKDVAKSLIRGKDVECLDEDGLKLEKEVMDELAKEIIEQKKAQQKALRSALGIDDVTGKKRQDEVDLEDEDEDGKKGKGKGKK